MQPINDMMKVQITEGDEFGFGADEQNTPEQGIVVALPDKLNFFGFHSFAFEHSFMDVEKLDAIYDYYKQLLGKRVYWKSLATKGMVLKEDGKLYAFVKFTDLIAFGDKDQVATNIYGADGGAFKV